MVKIIFSNGTAREFSDLREMVANVRFCVSNFEANTVSKTECASEIIQISVQREPLSRNFVWVIIACPQLQVLQLCWCNIDHNMVRCLIGVMAGNVKLREISLKGNPLGNEGALAFVPLVKQGKLNVLNLQFCGIGEMGRTALRSVAALQSVMLILVGEAKHKNIGIHLPVRFSSRLIVPRGVNQTDTSINGDSNNESPKL